MLGVKPIEKADKPKITPTMYKGVKKLTAPKRDALMTDEESNSVIESAKRSLGISDYSDVNQKQRRVSIILILHFLRLNIWATMTFTNSMYSTNGSVSIASAHIYRCSNVTRCLLTSVRIVIEDKRYTNTSASTALKWLKQKSNLMTTNVVINNNSIVVCA